MKRFFIFVACVTLLSAAAGPALANTACYEWDCDYSTHVCEFDASCTTITEGSLWRYRWDFGDGSSPVLTGSPTISHTYSVPYPDVNLTVYVFSADEFSVECGIVVWNQVGPPLDTADTCP